MGSLKGWDGCAFLVTNVGEKSATGLTAHFEFVLSGTTVRATGFAVAVPSRDDVQIFWNAAQTHQRGQARLQHEFPVAFLAERGALYGVEPLKPYFWLEELKLAAQEAIVGAGPLVKQCQAGAFDREELRVKLKRYAMDWAFTPET